LKREGTYTENDIDTGFGGCETLDGGFGADLDVALVLDRLLQAAIERLYPVFEREMTAPLEVVHKLCIQVHLLVHSLALFQIKWMRQGELFRPLILTLHAEETTQRTAISTFKLPCKLQERLRGELVDIAGPYAVENGADDVVRDPPVHSSRQKRANRLVGHAVWPLGTQGLGEHTKEATEYASPPQGKHVCERGQGGGQAVEAVRVVDEAVLCAGL
jgi:hypothetical protein